MIIDFLFLTFLMNGSYIRFLPYIWKRTWINTISKDDWSGFTTAKPHNFNAKKNKENHQNKIYQKENYKH